jgi:hypothetical protein
MEGLLYLLFIGGKKKLVGVYNASVFKITFPCSSIRLIQCDYQRYVAELWREMNAGQYCTYALIFVDHKRMFKDVVLTVAVFMFRDNVWI